MIYGFKFMIYDFRFQFDIYRIAGTDFGGESGGIGEEEMEFQRLCFRRDDRSKELTLLDMREADGAMQGTFGAVFDDLHLTDTRCDGLTREMAFVDGAVGVEVHREEVLRIAETLLIA